MTSEVTNQLVTSLGIRGPRTRHPGTEDTGIQKPRTRGSRNRGYRDPGTEDPGILEPRIWGSWDRGPGIQEPRIRGSWDRGPRDPGTEDTGIWVPGSPRIFSCYVRQSYKPKHHFLEQVSFCSIGYIFSIQFCYHFSTLEYNQTYMYVIPI